VVGWRPRTPYHVSSNSHSRENHSERNNWTLSGSLGNEKTENRGDENMKEDKSAIRHPRCVFNNEYRCGKDV
jgi:hypothetical protein